MRANDDRDWSSTGPNLHSPYVPSHLWQEIQAQQQAEKLVKAARAATVGVGRFCE